MADFLAIKGAVDAIKAARDIAKTAVDLRDAALLQDKVIELNEAIIAAQSSALDAQADQLALAERVEALERQIAEFEAWDAEQEKYELTALAPGTFAYTLKADTQGAEPAHWICANCFQHRQKSILQRAAIRHRRRVYRCQNCGGEIDVEGGGPEGPRPERQNQRPLG